MSYKLIPANIKYYDHFAAFEELDLIDWTASTKYEIGDIVYIYSLSPYCRISFKCEVVDINIDAEHYVGNDYKFFKRQSMYDDHKKKNKYVRLKLLANIDDKNITLKFLQEHGFKGRPQCQRSFPLDLVDAIEKCIK